MISAEIERRVIHALDSARQYLPTYANGGNPVSTRELDDLLEDCRIKVSTREVGVPTLLLPPMLGRYRLLIDPTVNRKTRDGYLKRHELGHVLAGDIDEPTAFQFNDHLPDAEMVADLFAFADLFSAADLEVGLAGVAWLTELKMEKMVEWKDNDWHLRVPRTAEALLDLYQRGSLW